MSIIETFIVPHPPLIIPDIGMGKERKIQKTIDCYDKIAEKISKIKPNTIIIITPHSIMYSDYIHISPGKGAKGNFKDFGEPNVNLEAEYDTDFINELSTLAESRNIQAGTMGEKDKSLDHGTMIPLYFINKYRIDYKIVRISISGLSFNEHYNFGKCISQVAQNSDKKVVLIASGDLSHMLKDEGPYGYREEGVIFDREVTNAIKEGNFLTLLKFDPEFCELAAECGLRSFITMAGALDGKSVESELLSYEGPFGVGYAVAEFTVTGENNERHFDKVFEDLESLRLTSLKNEEDDYVRLARKTLESYVINHKVIKKDTSLSRDLLENTAGVFVSLKLDGQLRGCIGTILPTTDCIAEEIIQNAISAGTGDPRFHPVKEDELDKLIYSVDVLLSPIPIKSAEELDPKRYGVIVTRGKKRGLLLPNLEGIDTPDEQISIALKKAGISQSEQYSMERFEVIRHK